MPFTDMPSEVMNIGVEVFLQRAMCNPYRLTPVTANLNGCLARGSHGTVGEHIKAVSAAKDMQTHIVQ
jgi:hypothetical protein